MAAFSRCFLINWLFIWFKMITMAQINELILFVSRNGMDTNGCGDWTNPCGTLFGASLMQTSNIIINVIDGQNEALIAWWNTRDDRYDPCLPVLLADDESITITFNSTNIIQFSQWFPENICDFENEKKIFLNTYMFDGGKTLTINNLIVNNYKLKSRFGLIASTYYNASIQCNNCVFDNITSYNNTNPLLYSKSSIQLLNNQFINVYSNGDIIYCTHSFDVDFAIRQFIIQTTSFINVYADSIVNMSYSPNDNLGGTTLEMNECTFENVYTITSIINDNTYLCNVFISNTIFDILDGSIYESKNHVHPNDIHITNVSITTDQLYEQNENSLLSFGAQDITNISYMNVLYSHDVNKSCDYYANYYNNINSVINNTCDVMVCQNPIVLISNQGKIQMDYVNIDMKISNLLTLHSLNKFVRYQFELDNSDEMAFIQNEGFAKFHNIIIKQSISYNLIYNTGNLLINHLRFDYIRYNPNALHSLRIIYQSGTQSVLSIYNSNFIGSYYQMHLLSGTAKIYNSLFQNSRVSIISSSINELVIVNNTFINNGQYNGPFRSDALNEDSPTQAIYIHESNNIDFINNSISGYDPKGLLKIYGCYNISLINNIFNIDLNLFYNISVQNIGFQYAPLVISDTSMTKLIGNEFDNNIVDETMAWVEYYHNYGFNCMSANIFNNYAFSAEYTNITSCYRPQLIECAHKYDISNKCKNGFYEHNELSLHNKIGIFKTTNDVILFNVSFSNIAIDNINITATNANNNKNGFMYRLKLKTINININNIIIQMRKTS
eukprot:245215_1